MDNSELQLCLLFFFFFNDTATTEIYTLSLHDALPIYGRVRAVPLFVRDGGGRMFPQMGLAMACAQLDVSPSDLRFANDARSEEHTSELQSRQYLVCRLLLEKKKKRS